MSAVEKRDVSETPTSQRKTPFGDFSLGAETHPALTIVDAVRRCHWIGMDLNAAEFGVFSVSPAVGRARLMPCFDSDHPKVSTSTKYMAGSNGEELVRHARTSTLPCWWSDGGPSASAASFGALDHAIRIAELVPALPGIAFPVHSERGECGIVAFVGPDMSISGEQLLEIHLRCFSLFDAVARIRTGEFAKVPSISKRELECLKLTANGMTSEDIAATLNLSVHTANQYLTNTTQKLNAVNKTHSVSKALRLGLIE